MASVSASAPPALNGVRDLSRGRFRAAEIKQQWRGFHSEPGGIRRMFAMSLSRVLLAPVRQQIVKHSIE
jgi:hypothetical protein